MLSIFGMIDWTNRCHGFSMIDWTNRCHGFTTTESIDTDKVVEHLNAFSLCIKRDTFIVLDNASVHRNKKVRLTYKVSP